MEKFSVKQLEVLSKVKSKTNSNVRLEELFLSDFTRTIDTYKKTTYFYAAKMFEQHQSRSEAIPHNFYFILENSVNEIGFVKTYRTYEQEIELIISVMGIKKEDFIKILKCLRKQNRNAQETIEAQEARNNLKQIFRKFSSKYKEAYISEIVTNKMKLLNANIQTKEGQEEYKLPPQQFIDTIIQYDEFTETITNLITTTTGIIPNTSLIKDIVLLSLGKNPIDALCNKFGITTPSCYNAYLKLHTYNRLKNFERWFSENTSNLTQSTLDNILKLINIDVELKRLSHTQDIELHKQKQQEYATTIERISRRLPAAVKSKIIEVSDILAGEEIELTIKDKKLVFTPPAPLTAEEKKECKKYEEVLRQISKIQKYVNRVYTAQSKAIASALKISTNIKGENQQEINIDYWYTEEKIINAINLIEADKLNKMPITTFNLLKEFLLTKGFLWAYISDNISIDIFVKIINNFESIVACCKPEDININNLHEIIKKANLYDYADDFLIGLVGQDVVAKVINYNQFSGVTVTDEIIHKRLRKLEDLAVRSEKVNTSSLPFTCDVSLGDYSLLRYRNNDPQVFTCGVDTKTCFFISVNENDFFFYSLLNKNGYIIKIVDKNNKLIARAACFRKNNVLMINGIRWKNNKVNPESQEEMQQMTEVIRLVELMSKKMIELTTQDKCPIDYVVCNKAGILENSELENRFMFENINSELFTTPINIYDDDWKDFVTLYDNEPEQMLQEVSVTPNKCFTTDFGNHYPALLISSRNYMPLTSPRHISYADQPSTYVRPRRFVKEYISAEINDDILKRINRIRALACYSGTREEIQEKRNNYRLIKDTQNIKSIIIGDDWVIIISYNNNYKIYFAKNDATSKEEARRYILRLTETMKPENPEDNPTQKEMFDPDIKIYEKAKRV